MEIGALENMSLQHSLQNLVLIDDEVQATKHTEKFLFGKVLSRHLFRRFTITEIVRSMWRTRGKLIVEKVSKNIFKFEFELT